MPPRPLPWRLDGASHHDRSFSQIHCGAPCGFQGFATSCVCNDHGLGLFCATRVSELEPSRSFVVPRLARRIEVKIASTRDEFEQAFLLLSAKYRARGYEVPSDKPFRFTPFHVLPRTLTFVAKHGKQVVATLSLVPDNELLGLPMEGLYGSEIAGLRRAGGRIAEATSLADRDLSTTEFLQVFLSLIKLLMQSHVRRGGDCWVVTVNPRHAAFYRRMLGFRRLGPRRSYDVVQGHPAEAYVLDVDSMQQLRT